jgi:hypothetical protein
VQVSQKIGLNYPANEHIIPEDSSQNPNYRSKVARSGKYVKSNGAGEGI